MGGLDNDNRGNGQQEFSAQRRFQNMEPVVRQLLTPGQEIDLAACQTISCPGILLVGNSHINSDVFKLRGVDHQSIGPLVYPGKSAVLDFLDIPGHNFTITKDGREVVTQRTFGKSSDRHDSVYYGELPDILGAGYKLYYAPVNTNGLHVRLIWGPHTELQYPVMSGLPEIPGRDLDRIRNVWKKVNLVDK